MKKNIFYAGAFMCAMTVLASCSNEIMDSSLQQDGMFSVTAGMGVDSRTAVEDKLNSNGEYDIVWSGEDKIYLYGNKSYAEMSLVSGAGDSEAQFDGRIYGYASRLENAIYPVPTVNGDGTFGLELGEEYNYSANSNAPMFGNYKDGYVTFSLMTAMTRINVDVEAGDEVELIMKGEEGQPVIIAGNATISSTGVLTLADDGKKSVKVTFDETGNFMLDVPVPVGQYKGYTVKLNGEIIADRTLDEAVPLTKGQILVSGSAEEPETSTPDSDEYELSDAAELRWFAEQVNAGNTFAGKTIKLTENIDLKNIPWTPVGNGAECAVSFRGTFDGQGHVISNILINEGASAYDGFFGSVWGATIENLVLENVSVESGRLVARVNGDEANSTTIVNNAVVNGSSTNKLFDKVEDGAVIMIDGFQLVKTSDELSAAIQENKNKLYLAEGEYKLPNVKEKNMFLKGENLETILDYSHMGGYQEVSGASFNFENMTVVNNNKGYPYPGLQHTAGVSYEKCHIVGTVNLFSPAIFKFCTFDSEGAEHNAVTYGSDDVTFENCEFTYGDRSVNCYAENASNRDVKVTFTDCTFTKVAGKKTTGAIETNSSLMKSLTLLINDCTVNEGDLWWISTYDKKKGANTYVTVDGTQTVTTAEQLISLGEKLTGNVEIALTKDITLGNSEEQCNAVQFGENVTCLTIYGNNKTLTLRGKAPYPDNADWVLAGIMACDATVTIKNLTIVNEKLDNEGLKYDADRGAVYSFVRGVSVTYENVIFDGGVQVLSDETFIGCTFTEKVLLADENGYAKNGRFCMFIDHEYDTEGEYEINLEGCTFNASGYGCVKVAGDKGAAITVNVKGCTFFNTCPSNSWDKDKTPKWDIKETGENITVNDLGGNTWSKGRNAGIGKG